MNRVTKVTISLDRDLLAAIDRQRATRRQTRSAFFREAAEKQLRDEQERRAVERYVRGYRECPETDEETAVIDQAGVTALTHEPWK
ncbi:MAG TPA: ribbon-helix-helix protein, CopG family [Thermomicrobiales bacterium]|nr:ribbon-helix-helix protein, CopG family [Thermomicrobiales bacterium]